MKKIGLKQCVVAVCLIFLFLTACSKSFLPNSDLYGPVTPGKPIPTGYSTYCLFLVPSYSMQNDYKEKEWKKLNLAFQFLGQSIGNENMAVWFWNEKKRRPSVERSRQILDILNNDRHPIQQKLYYTDSPLFVFMNYNPESKIIPKNSYYTAIALDGKEPDKIIKFMDKLAQSIRDGEIKFMTLENEQLFMTFKNIIYTLGPDLKALMFKVLEVRLSPKN